MPYRFKWLIVLICFLLNNFVMPPLLPGWTAYPDLTLMSVVVLGMYYGSETGLFYGAVSGMLSGIMFAGRLELITVVYAMLGALSGLARNKTRSSKVILPALVVGVCQVARSLADVVYLLLMGRASILPNAILYRAGLSALLAIVCALPLYWLLYKKNFRYRVIGKRVGTN